MPTIVESIRAEYLRYKALADAAIGQLSDEQLSARTADSDNSIAVICRHMSGNFQSRFTDFLTSDGEKSWRKREEEFVTPNGGRADLLAHWERGWQALLSALAELTDDHLGHTVTIRRQPLLVQEALLRSLAHASYHVGQIVYVAKSLRGKDWTYLSIPPGRSDAYNQAPALEKAAAQAAALRGLHDTGTL